MLTNSAFDNRFLFAGYDYNKKTGLYDCRNRFYHPILGRFLQPDPIGFAGGNNLYRYCGNNPVNRKDPNGLQDEWPTPLPEVGLTPPPPGHPAYPDYIFDKYVFGKIFPDIPVPQPALPGPAPQYVDDPFYPFGGPVVISPDGIWNNPNGTVVFDPATDDIGNQGSPFGDYNTPSDNPGGGELIAANMAYLTVTDAEGSGVIVRGGATSSGRGLGYVIDSYGRVAGYHPLTGTYSWSVPGLSDIANHFDVYGSNSPAGAPSTGGAGFGPGTHGAAVVNAFNIQTALEGLGGSAVPFIGPRIL